MFPTIFDHHGKFPLQNEDFEMFEAAVEVSSVDVVCASPLTNYHDPQPSPAQTLKRRDTEEGEPIQKSPAPHVPVAIPASTAPVSFARGGTTPTSLPELTNSWESAASSYSVGTPTAGPSNHPRDGQQFGGEDWDAAYGCASPSPASSPMLSSVSDEIPLLNLSRESARPSPVQGVFELDQEDVVMYMEEDELEICPIMATMRRAHADDLDTGFQLPIHPSQSLLFEGSDLANPFQLPSPGLSPLRAMSHLPIPFLDSL